MRRSLEDDLRLAQENQLEDVLAYIKKIEDKYNGERRPPILSFQEQAIAISYTIPHFSIRTIDYFEREQAR